jgi:cytochrome c oxidase subunit 4
MTQADAYSTNSSAHGHGHDGHHGDEPHVLPLSVYLAVWAALVVLTVITVAVSRFDFGAANTVIAMLVATVKGSLVALFFMHLYYDNKLNLIILISSLVFVAVFFTPTLIDLSSRGFLDGIKTRAGYKLATTPPSLDPQPAPEAAPAATPAPAAAPAPAEHAAAAPAAAAPAAAATATPAPAPAHPAAAAPAAPAPAHPAAAAPAHPAPAPAPAH